MPASPICTMTWSKLRRLNMLKHALIRIISGGFTPLNFVFPNLPLPSYRRRDIAHVKMRNFYLDIMKRRRESGSFDQEGHDMLQALQGATYKDGRVVSDKEIAHMMIALLMAGQHTSAATTSWILLHLGADQATQCV